MGEGVGFTAVPLAGRRARMEACLSGAMTEHSTRKLSSYIYQLVSISTDKRREIRTARSVFNERFMRALSMSMFQQCDIGLSSLSDSQIL